MFCVYITRGFALKNLDGFRERRKFVREDFFLNIVYLPDFEVLNARDASPNSINRKLVVSDREPHRIKFQSVLEPQKCTLLELFSNIGFESYSDNI